MRKIIAILSLSVFLLVQISACAPRVVYVPKKPPAKRVIVVKKAKPSPRAVWIEGHWKWNARKHDFVWVKGYWKVPPKGKVWVPGHWVKKPHGWVYKEGHWKRR
ncbi:hypothetical protein B6D60_08960 [candidate division KSB1 bacterium 4484_87]|nr:MAG: hypothetical protein B6D60_08960 [candidate division KSB1 bacterium 4484_87]